jgi:hypothetical protein
VGWGGLAGVKREGGRGGEVPGRKPGCFPKMAWS